MPDKFKKIDKEYLYTDDSMNTYGYRLLTSGYLIDEFKKNPIGYKMHLRDDGVVVRWEDFRIDGNKVYAKPVINLSHPQGQQIADEIEGGFLNGASVGKIVVLEVSSNPADYLPDQSGPSVSKWFHRELSLVDIPGNYNALTDLVDANGDPLNLSDFSAPNSKSFKSMKQIFLTPAQMTLMNLKADTVDSAAVDAALADLVAKATKHDSLVNDLAAANQKVIKAEKDLADLKAATKEKELNDLLAAGVNAGKLTKEMCVELKAVYEDKPDALKSLIDKMPAQTTVANLIDAQKKKAADLSDKSWEELDKSGKLSDLKAADLELFKAKFKEQFGVDYKG